MNPENATPLRLPKTPTAAAFDAGDYAMKQYFPRTVASRSEGRIDSGIVEYDQVGGTGRLRDDALKYKNHMRRKATLWIRPEGNGSVVRCQIRVQRLDTSDHQIFQQQQTFNDLPNTTPIDRDAGTTADQNQTWTSMPRDRKMERELLNVLFNHINQAQAN